MFKLTYEARGCPKKFHKVWSLWVDSEQTVSSDYYILYLSHGILILTLIISMTCISDVALLFVLNKGT